MTKNNILLDLFANDWSSNGILKRISTMYSVPWASDVPDSVSLDLDYFGNRSGYKIVSPLVRSLTTQTGLSNDAKNILANVIWYKFGKSWKKAYDALYATYNPLENYDRQESSSGQSLDTTTPNLTTTSTDQTMGFNSESFVDKDKNTTSSTGSTSDANSFSNTSRTHGNIGVTTSQQMIESELALRFNNVYFDMVYADIDSVLVTGAFGEKQTTYFYDEV